MIEYTSVLLYSLIVVTVSAILVAGAVWVLAQGAMAWANANAAVHRARAHGIEADMQRDTIEEARAAATRVMAGGSRPPTPDEIRSAILQQRRSAGNGEVEEYTEYTTSGDVTPDELNEHMQGGEFKQPIM